MSGQFTKVMDRMKRASNLGNGSRIARALGITPQAISNYKRRDIVPAEVMLRFSETFGVSLDWLVSGEGAVYKAGFEGKIHDRDDPFSAGINVNELRHMTDISRLSPDELIAVGKLLKVLRHGNSQTTGAIKNMIESIIRGLKEK